MCPKSKYIVGRCWLFQTQFQNWAQWYIMLQPISCDTVPTRGKIKPVSVKLLCRFDPFHETDQMNSVQYEDRRQHCIPNSLPCIVTSSLTPNFPLLSPISKLYRLPCSQILFFESTRRNCVKLRKRSEIRSESNAITCAGGILMRFLCYHQRKYFHKRQRPYCLVDAHTTWNLLTEQTKDVGEQEYKDSARLHRGTDRPSYLNLVSNLKCLHRQRGKGCLRKLSTKSQSQTHLHLPGCQSAFNFSRLVVPAPVSNRHPVSFLLKRHVQKAL